MKKHLSVANVLSCLALFVALSGAAYASGLGRNAVRTRNIANHAVNTPKLRNNAVNTRKLRNNAVNARKLRNGAVTGPKIAGEAVGTAKIGGGAVRSTNLGGGVVTTPKLKNLAVTGEKLSTGLLGQLLKNVSYVSKSSTSDKGEVEKEVTAECPAGKIAIGGGARISGGGATALALTQSFPLTNGATGKTDAWLAAAAPIGPVADDWGVDAHVICAEL